MCEQVVRKEVLQAASQVSSATRSDSPGDKSSPAHARNARLLSETATTRRVSNRYTKGAQSCGLRVRRMPHRVRRHVRGHRHGRHGYHHGQPCRRSRGLPAWRCRSLHAAATISTAGDMTRRSPCAGAGTQLLRANPSRNNTPPHTHTPPPRRHNPRNPRVPALRSVGPLPRPDILESSGRRGSSPATTTRDAWPRGDREEAECERTEENGPQSNYAVCALLMSRCGSRVLRLVHTVEP